MRWLDQRSALYGWPHTTSGPSRPRCLRLNWRRTGAPTWRPASNGSAPTAACSRAISLWKRWALAGPRCGMPLSASPRALRLRRSWLCSVGQRGGCIDWIDTSHCDRGPCTYNVLARRRRCQKPLRDEGWRNMPFGIPIRWVARRFMAITQSFGGQALAGFSSAKCLNEDNYFFQKLSRAIFGTNNVDHGIRLCHASRQARSPPSLLGRGLRWGCFRPGKRLQPTSLPKLL
jgi:hypothetical protein